MKDHLVAVVWADPRVDQANAYTREEIAARSIPNFTTFGLLVRDDPDVVAVAAEQGEDGSFRSVTYILRPLVRRIVPIMCWPRKARKPKATTPTEATA